MYNFDINVAEFGNTIEVDMGECKFLASDSKDVLFTKGLGPCVGVSVVIKTIDGKVYRLLAHVIMEYKEEEPFEELKACSKQMKKCINTNIESIAQKYAKVNSTKRCYFIFGHFHKVGGVFLCTFKDCGIHRHTSRIHRDSA